MAPVTLKTVDGELRALGSSESAHANSSHRRPQRCDPALIRDPVCRPRLSGPRDTAGACAEDVRHVQWNPMPPTFPYAHECSPSEQKTPRQATQLNPNPIHPPKLIHSSKNLTLALSTLSTHTQLPPTQENQPDTNTDPSNPSLASIQLPPEIIDYVDSARNPDIYTREFVELVQRGNQDLRGKREAFASFRDVLAREMRSAMPECRGEVDRVVAATGGAVDGTDGATGDAATSMGGN